MQTNFATFKVDGYEVSATFAESRNTAVCGQLKQILLASFASNAHKNRSGDCSFVNDVRPQKEIKFEV